MKRPGTTRMAALVAGALLVAAGACGSAQASGYAVFTQGASALGQGNAVTAHADDPSALFYNPALISKLEGTQLQVGTTVIATFRDFESAASGSEIKGKSTVFFPSTIYATRKVGDKLCIGLGVFNPFGLGTNWGGTWEGRYLATKSELTTFNINPVVSYRITPSLAVALGADVVILDATLEKKIYSPALGVSGTPFDFNQKFKGHGTGAGFNVGVAYDVNPDLSLGVSYRSEVKIDIDGTSTTEPGFAPLDVPGRTKLTLPQQLTAGIAYRVSKPLIVEAGLRWEGWSAFDRLAVTLDSPVAQLRSTESQRNWSDALGANIGVKYRLNDTVSLLGGYIYGSTPIPDSTFDPSIPDADTHIFCVGTDLTFKRLRVAVSYAYQKLDERNKNNAIAPATPPGLTLPNANGRYNTDAHLVALSVGYRF